MEETLYDKPAHDYKLAAVHGGGETHREAQEESAQ